MAESMRSLSSSGEGGAERSSSWTEGASSEDGAPLELLGASCSWESGVGSTFGERGGVSVTASSAGPSSRGMVALALSTTCDFEAESAAGDGGDTRWDATDCGMAEAARGWLGEARGAGTGNESSRKLRPLRCDGRQRRRKWRDGGE
jgi:hypothetical protein